MPPSEYFSGRYYARPEAPENNDPLLGYASSLETTLNPPNTQDTSNQLHQTLPAAMPASQRLRGANVSYCANCAAGRHSHLSPLPKRLSAVSCR